MISSFLRGRALPFLFVAFCLPLAALKAQPVISLTSSGYSVELGGTVLVDGVRVNGQAPFTCQWVEQGVNNTAVVLHDGATANGSTLSGTTTLGMTVAGATAGDAGAYAVEVTDANGASATSAWITLTVKAAAPPSITSQPGNVTVVAGNNASFSVSSTGSYPRTYQWYKGTPGSGSAIAGATTNPFTITGALAGDAGTYYVTVTNAYGSDTSAAATLTVNPATPITYSGSGTSQTAYVGQSLTLYMYPSGSTPITYQWQKNGAAIAGATTSSYTINPVALADAGTYTQVATNAAGTVTSPAITLTVNPATAVTFPATATPVTITAGQSLSLYMSANGGSSPITYQWQKNGTPITGATSTSYYKSLTTTADSGSYTVVGTNPAGSTTSPAIQVTVNPPLPPTITTPPASQSIAQGNTVRFSVVAGGSPPFTYQWLKNGTAIGGATYSYYSISAVQPSDAASYSVTVSNAAGTVTSAAAALTVLPPVPPYFPVWVQQASVNQGGSLTLNTPSPSNSGAVGPYTYQWFKNGSAISGATGYNYTINSAQFSDAGTYAVTVTNAGGTAVAPATEVTVNPVTAAGTAWLDAAQQGSVIYFLFASHIERYDLSLSTWLPSTVLSQTATALCLASDGVYVGFGRALAKFPLDLSSQTTLANLGASVTSLFSLGNYVYAVAGATAYPVNRVTGAVGAGQSLDISSYTTVSVPFAVAPAANKIYTPSGIWGPNIITADGTGSLSDPTNTDYYGTFARGGHAYLMPDQQHFADSGGTVFNVSDGKLAATFGAPFTDMAFLSDGTPVVLRGNVLSTYAPLGTKELSRTALSVGGTRIFTSGQNVVAFYPGTSAGNNYVGLTQVATSSFLTTYPTAPAADATSLSYQPGAVLQDKNGVVYLYDAAHENLFRWSPASHAYLAPITLGGSPMNVLYSSTLNDLYCVYRSGAITRIDLGAAAPVEQPFAALPDVLKTAVGADNFIFAVVHDASDSGEEEVVIDAQTGAITTLVGWGYYGNSYTWSGANQTLYADGGSTQRLSSTGTLPSGPGVSFSQGAAGTIFPSSDGTRLVAATGGQVYDATGFYLGVLGNPVTYAVWLGTTPYTVRTGASGGAEVQSWSATNFTLTATAELPGVPDALFGINGNQMLLVAQSGAVPTFTVLNSLLQRVSTTVPPDSASAAPTFITQPAAAVAAFAGTSVTLSVDTTGSQPQSFQWYKNGSAIGGANSAALSLAGVASSDAANYYVIASNSVGSTTSATTSLTVAPALAFTTQPQSQVMTSGSATFTAVVANDAGASYQWYFNRAAVSGATSNTLVVSPISSSNWGTYILKVSNTAGSVYSNAATLLPPAPVITTQPQSVTIAAGGSTSLSVSAQYATSYQWYLNGKPVVGAVNSGYWLNNATADNAGTYTVVVTGQGGSTTSAAAILTVGTAAPPTITTQPQSVSAAANTSVMLYVVGTNVTSYQWYFNGTAVAGATTSTLSLANFTSANAGNYTVVLTGPGGSVTSNVASVTVAVSAPAITSQPQSTTVSAGSTVTLSVAGSNATAYQWYRNGTAISGATGATLVLNNVTASNAGTYTVALAGPGGTVTSTGAVVTVLTRPFAGVYFGTLSGGGSWALWLPASGGNGKFIAYVPNQGAIVADADVGEDGSMSLLSIAGYWSGSPMPVPSALTGTISGGTVTGTFLGAMTGTLDTGTTAAAAAGYYRAVALGGGAGESYAIVGGSGQAYALFLGATAVSSRPDFASGTLANGQFSATSALGHAATLTVDANSDALTDTLADSSGTVASFGGLLKGVINTARLLNLSSRADVGSGSNVLITGFSIAGTGTKGILVRGVGPALKNYGLTDVLAAPKVTFNDGGGTALWSGTSWGGGTTLIATFNAVGAFPLDPASADAAHTFITSQGRYTATVSGADGGSGVALAEVYDTDTGPNGPRLVNLSARGNVQAGSGVLTAGLVIGGNGPETVLLRGVGPTLKNYGVADYLAAPQLTLRDAAGHSIAVNSGWTDAGGVTSAAERRVGAFDLTPGSADCVILATLMPGNYTVQVTSEDATQTGVALVEVYEVPQN